MADDPRVEPRPRLAACVERWPDCASGLYDPRCCRFPKSCSATVYDERYVTPDDLEHSPALAAADEVQAPEVERWKTRWRATVEDAQQQRDEVERLRATAPSDVAMPAETLAERIRADGAMFRVGYEEGAAAAEARYTALVERIEALADEADRVAREGKYAEVRRYAEQWGRLIRALLPTTADTTQEGD